MINNVVDKGTRLKSGVVNGVQWVLYKYNGDNYKVAMINDKIIRYIHYPAAGHYEVVVVDNG